MLAQFGTQGPDRTTNAGQHVSVINLQLREAAQSLLRRIFFVELLQQHPQSRNPEIDNGISNLVLRLKVVVEIAQRNPALLRNVSKRNRVEPVAMGDLNGGLKEPRTIVRFRFWHYST